MSRPDCRGRFCRLLLPRYVGTLHEINPEASTIALENVMSYGTEGRRGNPADEVAPSSSVYEYIVFRGSDVKDISVAEEEKPEPAKPEQPQVPNDPAILGVSEPLHLLLSVIPVPAIVANESSPWSVN